MRALGLAVVPVLAAVAVAASAAGPSGAPATCRHQSSAGFPPRGTDLVVGPLVLVGGRVSTSEKTRATFGGQKYPALVRASHRVVVEVERADAGVASLQYADDDRPHRVVAMTACTKARSGSTYGRRDVTFWSGFVRARASRCVHLRVWVDDEPAARRAQIALGRRCA
jgi:hypothetical protein